jgi:scyllo-inositol 2-dehydrogenase (NADP+)
MGYHAEPKRILQGVSDLRVAIVGYGLAGRFFHAPLIAATEGLAVASVVTSDPGRAAQVEREHPEARVLRSPDDLWATDEHDLVVIAAPNEVHARLATEAVEHGLPVVVDKPLAVSAAEAQAVVARAERAGVLLTVFQNRRWDSDYLTLARLMADGRLGSVMRFESRFERWRPQPNAEAWRESASPQRGGGVLIDLGSHLVDQALVRFGRATHVYAEVEARRGTPGDDDVFIALQHAGGVISHLRASAMTAAPGPRLRVLGDQAAFVCSELDSQEDRLRSGAHPANSPDWGVEPESRWGRVVAGESSEPVPSERGDWPRFYTLLRESLVAGGPPPVDPADAVTTLRILELARRSAEHRSVVPIPV